MTSIVLQMKDTLVRARIVMVSAWEYTHGVSMLSQRNTIYKTIEDDFNCFIN